MPMVIQHNMNAINTNRQLGLVVRGLAKSAEKLSSGYKINRAADDAAGLSISEKMRKQVRGLSRGIANTEDGVSLCQVADGALGEVHDMIQRLEELSVKAANGTNSSSDRGAIQDEVAQLLTEIDRISDTTKFNGRLLFGGSDAKRATVKLAEPTKPTEATKPTTPTTPTTCGDFTVTGGVRGTDYEFNDVDKVLTIKSDADITISGTTTTNRIEVAGGVNANITLKDVNIDLSHTGDGFVGIFGFAAFKIADDSTGNVSITLDGTNTLKGGEYCAGLQKNGQSSGIGKLTISGAGSLEAIGGSYGAGIGGGRDGAGSNITISSGTVTAISSFWGAGIGGGCWGAGSNITISGGEVTATGGGDGAGIGGGMDGAGSDITISGGEVTAMGGDGGGAGIGGGISGDGSDIEISGGEVTAMGGIQGAGIGGGGDRAGSDITISGGEVTATGGNYAAGIGGGINGDGSDIEISGGTVTATGGDNAAGIGGGDDGGGNNITISGGSGSAACGAGAQKIGSGKNAVDGTANTVYGKPAPADATDRNGGTFVFGSPVPPTPPADPTPPPTPAEPTVKSTTLWIQSGCEADDGIFVSIDGMNTRILGLDGMDLTTEKGAYDAMNAVDSALAYISKVRSKIGAQQNRLEHTIDNESNIVENTAASESQIRDTDMAAEMVRYSNLNILQQAGESMLTQANQSKQGVLSLLA